MFLQDKEGSRWEAHKTQIPPVCPCSHAEMGGGLLRDLLLSVQFHFYQGHAHSEYSQRAPH